MIKKHSQTQQLIDDNADNNEAQKKSIARARKRKQFQRTKGNQVAPHSLRTVANALKSIGVSTVGV
jgi:hypothetical protein